MRLAAIDLGTNSARILLVEEENILQPIYRSVEITRLGEGVNEKKMLQPQAIARTIEALEKFKQKMSEFKVEKFRLVATSAVRDARNKDEFVHLIEKKTGFKLDVISGEEEAELTYWGITADLSWPSGNILAFDLGGGSTEVILGNKEEVKQLTSLDIGAVRMTEAFLLSDPVQEEEVQVLKDYLQAKIMPFLEQLKRQDISILIGVGGTATALAAMEQNLLIYDPQKVHGYFVKLESVKQLACQLKKMNIKERKKIAGLHPKRADIILGGVEIVQTFLEGLNLNRFMVSENDILLGIIIGLKKV